jgi:hypothetical protein
MTPAQRCWHLRIWIVLGPALLLGAAVLWAMGRPAGPLAPDDRRAEVNP